MPYMTKQLGKPIIKSSELESKYLKKKTIDNKNKFKKQDNFYGKLYKKQQKKIYSDLDLNKTTDNKLFWKTMKPPVSDTCLQSFTISVVDNKKWSLMSLNLLNI